MQLVGLTVHLILCASCQQLASSLAAGSVTLYGQGRSEFSAKENENRITTVMGLCQR